MASSFNTSADVYFLNFFFEIFVIMLQISGGFECLQTADETVRTGGKFSNDVQGNAPLRKFRLYNTEHGV